MFSTVAELRLLPLRRPVIRTRLCSPGGTLALSTVTCIRLVASILQQAGRAFRPGWLITAQGLREGVLSHVEQVICTNHQATPRELTSVAFGIDSAPFEGWRGGAQSCSPQDALRQRAPPGYVFAVCDSWTVVKHERLQRLSSETHLCATLRNVLAGRATLGIGGLCIDHFGLI